MLATTRDPEAARLREVLMSLSDEERDGLLAELSPVEQERILYDWHVWARDNQLLPPDDPVAWTITLWLAGRGFGKTRSGAEVVRQWARENPGEITHLVAPTSADYRQVMVEGESGILNISPEHERPTWNPTNRKLTWPNGHVAFCFSAEEPERLRGPQCHRFWADELESWARQQDTWDMLMFGWRLGKDPRGVVTTTPKASKLLKMLIAMESVQVIRGSTYDNRSNLSDAYFSTVIAPYENTRLGRQELYAEVMDDVPGALWQRAMLDAKRRTEAEVPDMKRIAVAIDPATTSGENADETGIVVVGRGVDDRGYVLADYSCRETPDGWAQKAVGVYQDLQADVIVGEVNQGGDMIESLIRVVAPFVNYKSVRATRGKRVRAEPVAALYEQGRVSHVGVFDELEDQMTAFAPDSYQGSPDRVDALVWAFHELFVDKMQLAKPRAYFID